MNPLTVSEKKKIKDWANLQHLISRKYTGAKSEFYRGRSVGAGKIARQYNPDLQVIYSKKMKPYLDRHEVEIKRVNNIFLAGKMSLTEMNYKHKLLNKKLDKIADRIRKEVLSQTTNPRRFDPILESLDNEEEEEMIGAEINPLKQFCCSICGKCAPRKLLPHGKFEERMDWLRKHYKSAHPQAFKSWYKNPGILRAVTNPIFETIGSAAITGVGLGAGFRAVDWATKKIGRKNPEYLYLDPTRLVKYRLETLFRTQPSNFYLYKDAIKDAIRDREKGKIPKTVTLRSLTLTELKSVLGFANRLYR